MREIVLGEVVVCFFREEVGMIYLLLNYLSFKYIILSYYTLPLQFLSTHNLYIFIIACLDFITRRVIHKSENRKWL